MFTSGADQSQAELRAPSVKGALRYWWRAMRSNLAVNNLNGLREREGDLFGDTKHRAKVVVQVDYEESIKRYRRGKLQISSRYDRVNRTLTGEDRGIGYLFYSTLLQGGKPYLDTGCPFTIHLRAKDKGDLSEAIKGGSYRICVKSCHEKRGFVIKKMIFLFSWHFTLSNFALTF